MQGYLVRRLVLFIPTLLIASFIVFGVMRFLPGDVALMILGSGGEATFEQEALDDLREELGLNKHPVVQYRDWAWSMLSGDFGGRSLQDKEGIRSILARRLPVTLQLTVYTVIISLVISLPMGIISALWQNRWPDYLVRFASIGGVAFPNFWVALMLILGLAVFFNWSMPIVYVDLWEDPWNHIQRMFWPAVVLAWTYSSYITRVTRSTLLEVLRQDYIRTARSKGLGERSVVMRHALRNALIPVITVGGIYMGSLLGGTVVIETIYSLPGLGQGVAQAAFVRDYPVVQSLAVMLVFFMMTVNLVTDILYAVVDPRISYSE